MFSFILLITLKRYEICIVYIIKFSIILDLQSLVLQNYNLTICLSSKAWCFFVSFETFEIVAQLPLLYPKSIILDSTFVKYSNHFSSDFNQLENKKLWLFEVELPVSSYVFCSRLYYLESFNPFCCHNSISEVCICLKLKSNLSFKT